MATFLDVIYSDASTRIFDYLSPEELLCIAEAHPSFPDVVKHSCWARLNASPERCLLLNACQRALPPFQDEHVAALFETIVVQRQIPEQIRNQSSLEDIVEDLHGFLPVTTQSLLPFFEMKSLAELRQIYTQFPSPLPLPCRRLFASILKNKYLLDEVWFEPFSQTYRIGAPLHVNFLKAFLENHQEAREMTIFYATIQGRSEAVEDLLSLGPISPEAEVFIAKQTSTN